MSDRKVFKVVASIEKKGGGHFWMRCGTAMVNRDNSINVYLDAVPRELKFTLRELDEEDLRARDNARARNAAGGLGAGGLGAAAPSYPMPIGFGEADQATGNDNAPF